MWVNPDFIIHITHSQFALYTCNAGKIYHDNANNITKEVKTIVQGVHMFGVKTTCTCIIITMKHTDINFLRL